MTMWQGKMKEMASSFENQIESQHNTIEHLNDKIKQMLEELKLKDRSINDKENELVFQTGEMRKLELEIQRLREMNSKGGMATAELQKLLQETQDKLDAALKRISELEKTIETNERLNQQEQKRLNTEIERLNNILKATNSNLAEQV